MIKQNIISNENINDYRVKNAQKIILGLYDDMQNCIDNGYGPFVAAVYDENYNLIVKSANSVINGCCSNNHAEMNAIKQTEEKLGEYDLSKYNLKLFVTAEPCIMCLGGIMWSGIKEVYYGVPTEEVEKITGFDEGFKPNWQTEFKKRGIIVYGNIEAKRGCEELSKYVKSNRKIYNPQRNEK